MDGLSEVGKLNLSAIYHNMTLELYDAIGNAVVTVVPVVICFGGIAMANPIT